jgi:hypothetical protein
MTVEFIGTGFPLSDDYAQEERNCWASITQQIEKYFPDQINLLISLTWFGPQFVNSDWHQLFEWHQQGRKFDNLFLVATVDPPYLNTTELQEIKNLAQALKVYHLGNFDNGYQFNFFATAIAPKFKKYTDDELLLEKLEHIFVNYNRKPKIHRVEFVKRLIDNNLIKCGTVTLGRGDKHENTQSDDELYLSIGEKHEDYTELGNRHNVWNFGLPQDYYSLHRMDIWKTTFLYINGATEFDPINDLFCQQDTFKPMLGLRPFAINGVQRTYRWLRVNGFKTFNHYWPHIDIENGSVHGTLIELIEHLQSLKSSEIIAMYNDMLPDLKHNRDRFFEFAKEQQYKMDNLFK